MPGSTAPTLRTLLARPDLRLSLVSAELDLASGALDRAVRWVHSSDLADPTPFLTEELVLLTTGSQLVDSAEADDYVTRLVRRGVLALGFGSGVLSAGVPRELTSACAEHGLPLFEVPYDTPFIAIARSHAEAIATQAYARRTWALETQRALTAAALRPRGLEATLTELAHRLGCRVAMYDPSGTVVHQHPQPEAASSDPLAASVAALLERGNAASRTVEHAGVTRTLFTLGRTGQLRGVVAVDAPVQDSETRGVVTSVIAMAGLALEQGEQLARGRRRMHAQLLVSLLDDDPALARRVLGALPQAPVVVAVAETGSRSAGVVEWANRRAADAEAALFAAEHDDRIVLCLPPTGGGMLDELAARFALPVGVSEPADYGAFSRAHDQARAALRRAGTAPGAHRFAEVAAPGILAALDSDEARLIAAGRLAPVRDHDARTGGQLETALRTWLEHDARIESAATALGIHRHTLRARIAQASTLLGSDLSSFPARAELWAALQAAR